MNILHISPYLPSLDTNHAGGVCMGKQIETLRENHQVYVLTFVASKFDKKLFEKLKTDTRYHFVKLNRLSKIIHVALEPWMPNYFAVRSSFRFACKLIWCVHHYHIDAIHCEYASMAQYQWIRLLFPNLVYNITEHDVTVQSYQRKLKNTCMPFYKKWYLKYQLSRLIYYEKRYCQQADHVITFSEKDKKLLEKSYGISDVLVLNPYFGIEDKDIEIQEEQIMYVPNTICFLGQMGRDENSEAAERLIKLSQKLSLNGYKNKVYIVGNNPPEHLKRMAGENVYVTGFVDDVDCYVKQAYMSVFPLKLGAGIKLKVLRSMALGTPVITSSVGAEGIDEKGHVLFFAETDDEFVDQMEKMFEMSRNDYQKLCKKNLEYVKQYFSWGRSAKILKELYGAK